MFHLITCVVPRGNAKKIIDAAVKAGAQTATFFDAQSKNRHTRSDDEPRTARPGKEVILIVTASERSPVVFDEIVATGHLKEPGKGFALVQEMEKTVGFFEE